MAATMAAGAAGIVAATAAEMVAAATGTATPTGTTALVVERAAFTAPVALRVALKRAEDDDDELELLAMVVAGGLVTGTLAEDVAGRKTGTSSSAPKGTGAARRPQAASPRHRAHERVRRDIGQQGINRLTARIISVRNRVLS
jgi:hypothetical protein